MVTDKSYNILAEDVYKVDSGKVKDPVITGNLVADGQFQVLKTEDNTSNGMQAMAVAPLVDGQPDTSRIVIAYAGTNSGDIKDIQTDLQSIGGGADKLTYSDMGKTFISEDTQFETALDFAESVKSSYPDAQISTTGHSLGQSTAMYVALKNDWTNVGYNGPDIHKLLSEEEIAYMQDNPDQFRNYRHFNDVIGNVMGDKTKTAIYTAGEKGKTELLEILDYHSLGAWQFSEDGDLLLLDGQESSGNVLESIASTSHQAKLSMKSYQKLASTLSAGGYSTAERIFLDSAQASIIATAIGQLAQSATEGIEAICQGAKAQAEAIWTTAQKTSTLSLSQSEVLAALSDGGVTEDSIVGATERHFDAKLKEATALSTSFESARSQITSGIQEKLASDQELAGRFNQWQEML